MLIRKDPVIVNFGRNVQQRRKSLKLSQEKLAELCEMHKNYIGFIERGERKISLLAAIKIAQALNTDLQNLINPFEENQSITDYLKEE